MGQDHGYSVRISVVIHHGHTDSAWCVHVRIYTPHPSALFEQIISPEVDPVGSAWTSNLHPTPTIELLQGVRGDAGCMAKARLFVTTGRPVQPHDSEGLEDLNVRFRWAAIPAQIVKDVGLEGVIGNPRQFKAYRCSPVVSITRQWVYGIIHVRHMTHRCMRYVGGCWCSVFTSPITTSIRVYSPYNTMAMGAWLNACASHVVSLYAY